MEFWLAFEHYDYRARGTWSEQTSGKSLHGGILSGEIRTAPIRLAQSISVHAMVEQVGLCRVQAGQARHSQCQQNLHFST
jgi:hypothetical protein